MSKLAEIKAALDAYHRTANDASLGEESSGEDYELDRLLQLNAVNWLTDLLAIAEAAQAMRAEIKNIPQTVMTYHMYDVVADYDKAAAKLEGE